MYLGSVRFFKHIIIGMLLLISVLFFLLIFNIFRFFLYSNTTAVNADTLSTDISTSSDNDLQTTNTEGRANAPGTQTMNSDTAIRDNDYKTADTCTAAKETDTKADDCRQDYAGTINKSYQSLYPDLYCTYTDKIAEQNKTVYLTFDDGPSQQTIEILNILKKNNVKATFFVIGKTDKKSKEIMKQIVDDGNTIGIHSYTHDYNKIYSSVEAFLKDFDDMYSLIYEATGVKPGIYRFPGGSINTYDSTIYKDIIEEMNRRGFTYYDWNVSASDIDTDATEKSIYNNVISEVQQHSTSIVLFHDNGTKSQTAYSLDKIIANLKNHGYSLEELSNKTEPIIFKIK